MNKELVDQYPYSLAVYTLRSETDQVTDFACRLDCSIAAHFTRVQTLHECHANASTINCAVTISGYKTCAQHPSIQRHR